MNETIKANSLSEIYKSTKFVYKDIRDNNGNLSIFVLNWIVSAIFTIVENLIAKSKKLHAIEADITLIKRTLNLEIKDKK